MATADDAALPLTTLGRFELLNAIRLSVFRQQLNRRVAAIDVLTIKADIESGVLEVTSCDWAAVHAEAERLSAKHTAEGGHRSMDILHVATALSLGASEFLSCDRNQARLASAEGLKVKP
jgi:predicted nucleic acid-binding protein